jgi:hypothetical protein
LYQISTTRCNEILDNLHTRLSNEVDERKRDFMIEFLDGDGIENDNLVYVNGAWDRIYSEVIRTIDYRLANPSKSETMDAAHARQARNRQKENKYLYIRINEVLSTPEERKINPNAGLDKYMAYNLRDCEACAELFFAVRDGIKDCVSESFIEERGPLRITRKKPVDISQSGCNTMNQLIFKYMPGSSKLTVSYAIPIDSRSVDISSKAFYLFCRLAIYAGRSQIFMRGWHTGKFASLDVKSLYPFVMIHPSCYYPIGRCKLTEIFIEGKLGIYKCIIGSQAGLPTKIIPKRDKDGSYNWNCDDVGEATCTSVDILTLREYGVQVDIISGYYWEESSNDIFATYIRPIAMIKTREDQKKALGQPYNPALRELCKLFMNGLSGKMLQRVVEKIFSIENSEKGVTDFYEHNDMVTYNHIVGGVIMEGKKVPCYNKAKPLHIGVFIYSYARRHMYKAILSKLHNKILTDTDSCLVNLEDSEVKNLLASSRSKDDISGDILIGDFGKFNLGGKFGDFEDEFPGKLQFGCNTVYAVAPKFYACTYVDNSGEEPNIITNNGIDHYHIVGENADIITVVNPKLKLNKMCCKGVGKRDKRIISTTSFSKEEFNRLPTDEKFNIYTLLPKALTLELYADMIDVNEVSVNVLCGHICRKLNNNKFSKGMTLMQEYRFKKLR